MAESGVGDEREEDNTFLFNFFDMKYFVVSPSTVDLAGLAYTVYFTMLKIFFFFFYGTDPFPAPTFSSCRMQPTSAPLIFPQSLSGLSSCHWGGD